MLNQILAEASAAMDPPMVERKRLNLMYVTQIGSSPPRLAFFSNFERDIPAHYIRFLETRFRKALKMCRQSAALAVPQDWTALRRRRPLQQARKTRRTREGRHA